MRPSNTRHLLILGLCVVVCAWPIDMARAEHPPHTTHPGQEELPAETFTQASIYQLESTWTTATGQPIRLGDLRGKPQVLAMIYTTCEYACPLLVSRMQHIAASLAPELRPNVGFVLVIFDPERDTPGVLHAYSQKMHLDSPSWTLLHGHPEAVLELAVLLGVRYKKDRQGGFAHANVITVLNKAGEIVHRHEGLRQSLEETLAAIRQAVQG
jgi:protein SCO1/2